jgi:hypothetical protein
MHGATGTGSGFAGYRIGRQVHGSDASRNGGRELRCGEVAYCDLWTMHREVGLGTIGDAIRVNSATSTLASRQTVTASFRYASG